MRDISNIVTQAYTTAALVPNTRRDQYVEIDALNPSSLAMGLIGIEDYNPSAIKFAWESPDKENAPAVQDRLNRGTLAHLMILQPELLIDRVAVWHGGRRNSNEWKAFKDEHAGKLLIPDDDNTDVSLAINAMRSEPAVTDLIRGIRPEVAVLATEARKHCAGFIAVKGQVDGINIGKKTIIDLKTTEAGIDQRSVERTSRRLKYREKMAMYRRWVAQATGIQTDAWQCFNIFLSLTPPYGIVVVKFTSAALEWGELRMLAALESVDKCLVSGEWPMYSREIFLALDDYECGDYGEDVNYEE